MAAMPEWLVSLIASLISSGIVAALFERRLKIAEAKLKEAEASKTHAETENIAADTKIKQTSAVAATNDEWRELYEQQHALTDELQKQITQQKSQANAAYSEFQATLGAEHKRSVEREGDLYLEIDKLRADVFALQLIKAENATLKEENTTLRRQVKELRAEVSQLRDENAELREKLAALTKRLTELEVKTGPFKKSGTEPAGR